MNEMYHIESEIKSKISEYSGACIVESITVDLIPVNYCFNINAEYNREEIKENIKRELVHHLAKQIMRNIIPLDITHEFHTGRNTIYSINILQEKERVAFIREIERLKKRKEEIFREKLKVENELERINDLSFWKTIKMAFKKLRRRK